MKALRAKIIEALKPELPDIPLTDFDRRFPKLYENVSHLSWCKESWRMI